MAKSNKERNVCSIFLIALGAALISIFIPIIFAFILGMLFPTVDAYLLTGFCFFMIGMIAVIAIPAVLLIVISVKSREKGVIKKFCKNYKVFVLIIALPLIIIEIALAGGGYTHFKDIKAGPQEAVMTDVVVKRRSTDKSSSEIYLIGYIDGEERKLSLTQEAKSVVKRGENYESLKIKYYENIAEVFEIEMD